MTFVWLRSHNDEQHTQVQALFIGVSFVFQVIRDDLVSHNSGEDKLAKYLIALADLHPDSLLGEDECAHISELCQEMDQRSQSRVVTSRANRRSTAPSQDTSKRLVYWVNI